MPERGKYDRALSAAARKKEQRRALLVAATAVFAKRGYVEASVEDIVREAGVSRRTYYEHFDDLADALAAVHDASGKLAIRFVEDEVHHAAKHEKLEHGIRALLTLVSQNAGLARVLFGEGRAAGPRFETRQEKLRAHFAELLSRTLHDDRGRAPDSFAVVAVVAGIEAVGAKLAEGGSLEDATAAMVKLARAAA
jgi:AcrR family transcriptional regulator